MTGGIDEALAGVVVRAKQLFTDAEVSTELQGHRFTVEKAVRSPFAEEAFFVQAPDLAAGAFFFFKDRHLRGNARGFGQSFNRMGGGKSGNPPANNGNLSHRMVSMVS